MKLELVSPGDTRFRDWMRRYREETAGEPPPDAWLDRYLDALFADQGQRRHIWWAVDNGRRVGFGVVVLNRHWADQARTNAQIGEFFIYPEYRREGLGRRFAQALIEWIRTYGVSDIQSGVVAGNLRGLRFWEAVGFQIARYALIYRPDRPREADEDE
jgi:GNAT superfamily N-acetyltransferase